MTPVPRGPAPRLEARATRLLRWYPRGWRDRYGAEFTELLIADLADQPHSWRRTADVAVNGMLARLSRAGLGGRLLDPADQAAASLATLGCAVAVFLTFGTMVWSQLAHRLAVGAAGQPGHHRGDPGDVRGHGAVPGARVCWPPRRSCWGLIRAVVTRRARPPPGRARRR